MANILIIEDNDDVAELFKALIEEKGHYVERSAAAYGAVLRIAKTNFDLVLMDLLLQGANGAVASLALRGLGYVGPIIVITGGLMPLDEDICNRAGFAARLLKPVRPEELLNEINNQLEKAKEK
jgi:CheY-like chemotaxis protein